MADGPVRRRWWLVGAAALVVVVVALAVFRPDKLFVDQRVDEQLDAGVAAALDSPAAPPTTPPVTDAPAAEPAPTAPTTPPTTAAPEPVLVGRGEFVSQGGHTVMGVAAVVDGPDGRQLVLSELDAENGPDLQLYVSPRADGSVDGGVRIAPLKGNQGTQVYELPAGVDLGAAPHVVIWCERFSTPFGTASLS